MTLNMTMTDPDQGLVDGLSRRDLCTVQLLISRKFHRITGLFQALMGCSGAEAEALATQVLRTVQFVIDEYNARDVVFDTWLHRVAVNLWRSGGVRPAGAGATAQVGLMILGERQRLCLVLSAYQGISAREIARILSLSIHQVETALKEARQTLARTRRSGSASYAA